MYFFGARLPKQFYNSSGGCSPHNGIVNQNHSFPFYIVHDS